MGDQSPLAGMAIDPLKIELRPTSSLKPAKRNARTHSDEQIEQIASSIAQFGFLNPVLVDTRGRLVAGHGRVEAARLIGIEEIPTLCIAHLSEAELRAYALADNRIAEKAGWDSEILRIELAELQELDLDFEIEITGFNTGEIEVIMDGAVPADDPALDDVPEPDNDLPGAVMPGDLWVLGDHRLLCGSSLEHDSFARVMGDERARMVFSDPPYNVKIDGHVGGLGNIRHAEFQMAAGEMSRREFTEFLGTVFGHEARFSIDGAIHFQCMDWRHLTEMMEAGESVYSELKNLCVWSKDNGGMGTFYRSRHELVFVWKVGESPHLNTVELGRNGRYRTNVWEYRGATKTGKHAELAMHPTVKPVPLVIDAIKDTSRRGDIVLDAFGGSGSTLIAAEKTNRRARLIELEPKYCAVTIARWEQLTGHQAVLDGTGETWSEVTARRGGQAAADPLEENWNG